MNELVYVGLAISALGIIIYFLSNKYEEKKNSNNEKSELQDRYNREKKKDLFRDYLVNKEAEKQLDIDISFLKKKIYGLDIVNIQFKDLEKLRVLLGARSSTSLRIKELELYKNTKLDPQEEIVLLYGASRQFDSENIDRYLPSFRGEKQCYLDNSYSKAREFFEKQIIEKEKEAIDLELGGKK